MGRFRQYLQYRRVFASHADIRQFRELRDRPQSAGLVSLKVRNVPNALVCRAGTMDAITLWDAFGCGYHLPYWDIGPGWIVDLGANAGYTTASLASRFPSHQVAAVEMDSDNAALCRRNLEGFGARCHVVQAAIWHEDGAIVYGGSNVHNLSIGKGHTPTRAMRADTLLNKYGIARVAYCKIDIEGAEHEVVSPGAAWLDQVDQIGLEVHPPGSRDDFAQRLRQLGWECKNSDRHPWGLWARHVPGR